MKITRKDFLRLSGWACWPWPERKPFAPWASDHSRLPRRPRNASAGAWRLTCKNAVRRMDATAALRHATPHTTCRSSPTERTRSSGYGRSRSRMYFRRADRLHARVLRRPTRVAAVQSLRRSSCQDVCRSTQLGNGITAWSPSIFIAASAAAIAWQPVPMARAVSTGRIPGPPSQWSTRISQPGREASWRSAISVKNDWREGRGRRARELRGKSHRVCDLEKPDSEVRQVLRSRFAVQRKPELGTGPSVYYIV